MPFFCQQGNKLEEAEDKYSTEEDQEDDTVEEDQEEEEEEEEEISDAEQEFELEEQDSPEPRKKRKRPAHAQVGQRKRGRPAVNREGAAMAQHYPAPERTERRRKRSEHEQGRMEKDLEVDTKLILFQLIINCFIKIVHFIRSPNLRGSTAAYDVTV